MPRSGSRKCQIRFSGRFSPNGMRSGAVLSQLWSSLCFSVRLLAGYASRRAPMSELPCLSCRPNQGTWRSSESAFNHSETSASSTATGFRSTPKTLWSAMYIITRCFSAAYCDCGMRSPVALWASSRYLSASWPMASLRKAADPMAGSQMVSSSTRCARAASSAKGSSCSLTTSFNAYFTRLRVSTSGV